MKIIRVSSAFRIYHLTKLQRPCCMHVDNIRFLICFYQRFAGKFVFDKKNPTLVVSPGQKLQHKEIADIIWKKDIIDRQGIVGARLDWHKTEGQFVFSLRGSSGYFGCPDKEEFGLVVSYLMNILRAAGFVTQTGLLDPCQIIVNLPVDISHQ